MATGQVSASAAEGDSAGGRAERPIRPKRSGDRQVRDEVFVLLTQFFLYKLCQLEVLRGSEFATEHIAIIVDARCLLYIPGECWVSTTTGGVLLSWYQDVVPGRLYPSDEPLTPAFSPRGQFPVQLAGPARLLAVRAEGRGHKLRRHGLRDGRPSQGGRQAR